LELDDPRWDGVQQALGSGGELPNILKKIAAMRSWNDAAWPPGKNPWDYLMQAVYDFGNVHSSAYAVVPHIVRFAEKRSVSDQTHAFLFVLNIVFRTLEDAVSIPLRFMDEFQTSIEKLGPLAEQCLPSRELLEGERKIAVATALLAGRDLVVGRVAYGLALEQLTLPCTACGNDIEFEFDDGRWLAKGDDETGSVTASPVPSAAFEEMARLSAAAQLPNEYEHVRELESVVECPSCKVATNFLALSAADVDKRCPLARIEGWEAR